ncbi:MAG: DUF2298 domain-containing protein [Patescibacteria group bacterium]
MILSPIATVYNFAIMAFQLIIINLVVGIISFPVTCLFFKKLSDKGYALAHLLGWFSISYISFFSSHLGIPVYYTKYLAFFIWLGINLYIEVKYRPLRNNLTLSNILITQGVFLFFATLWYFARIGDFRLNTIERTPDFGIIKSLFNTTALPPTDIWLAGKTINYYYFGHYVAFVMMSLSGVDPVAGFFLIILWMFGTYAASLYRFGKDLFNFATGRNYLSMLSGFMTVFFVLFAGNLYAVKYLWTKDFWYPEPTRFIEGTITEIPFYSFFISDLHAHVWGLGIGIMVLFTLLILWYNNKTTPLYKNYYVYFTAFLLGLALITNTWDVLTLGLLSGVVIFVKYVKHPLTWKDFGALFLNAFIILLVSIVWLISYKQEGSTGIGMVNEASGLWNLFLNWGGFVIPAAVFSIIYSYKFVKSHTLIFIVYFVSLFLIVLTEVFFVKDVMSQGPFQRANTVFKVYMQVWIWLGAVSGVVFTIVLFPAVAYLRLNKSVMYAARLAVLVVTLSLVGYPIMTSKQTIIPKFNRSVYAGVSFFSDGYPADYKAYLFLKNIQDSLPNGKKQKVIIEAPGESFRDENLFSSYLGWSTILGWGGHVWTYRGTPVYLEERSLELNEVYAGTDVLLSISILKKYKVDYIIVGSVEKRKYPNLNMQKLLSLGNKIYDEDGTTIIEVVDAILFNPYQSVPTMSVR